MSDSAQPAELPRPKEKPEALVLRGRPRPAVRFRRGLIVGLTGAVTATLIGLSWFALEPPSFRTVAAAGDSDEAARKAPPDALANVPGSYGEVPRLGPPLPGDLGRPILEQQRSLASAQPPAGASPATASGQPADGAVSAERERLEAAGQAARTSALLVQLDTGRSATAQESAPASAVISGPDVPVRSAAVAPDQRRKIEFARPHEGGPNRHELTAAPSPWTLSAGTVIPASLITGLDSDLPGTVLAQVSENVRDSGTGRTILVPQGARLIGRYDSIIAYGQRRALVVWTRIVLPDGASIQLDNLPAKDAAGYAGLEDRVDSHTWRLFKGIGLSTLLGVSTQLSIGGGGELVRALRESTEQNAAHAGDQITSRNLDVHPTIRVRPGWPVRVLVDRDLVLQPWRS